MHIELQHSNSLPLFVTVLRSKTKPQKFHQWLSPRKLSRESALTRFQDIKEILSDFKRCQIYNKISGSQRNQTEWNEVVACYLKKGVSDMLPSMELSLDKVYSFRRGSLWKRLNAEFTCVVVFFHSIGPDTFWSDLINIPLSWPPDLLRNQEISWTGCLELVCY